MLYLKFKRLIDIILSLLGLIILSPVFLLIAIAIKLDSKGPVFFIQKRIGMHKKHFDILKLRTMRIDTPSDMPTYMLENLEQWITKVGKFLRKAKLDGEYVERIGLLMDVKCFLGTIYKVIGSDGVIEGGSGSINKSLEDNRKTEEKVVK